MSHTWGQEYERSRARLRAVAVRYVGADADDVVHDAFVSALVYENAFRGDAAPSTWLYRIVVNGAISHRRKRDRQHRADGRLNHRSLVSVRADDRLALQRALEQLADEERRVLVMYYLVGLTHREIAEQLAIPVGTSKWRLARARHRLRDALQAP